MGAKARLSMEVENSSEELTQYQTLPEDLNPFSKPEALGEDEDILSAIKGLQLEEEELEKHEVQQDE
jgi:hypothetical protein